MRTALEAGGANEKTPENGPVPVPEKTRANAPSRETARERTRADVPNPAKEGTTRAKGRTQDDVKTPADGKTPETADGQESEAGEEMTPATVEGRITTAEMTRADGHGLGSGPDLTAAHHPAAAP